MSDCLYTPHSRGRNAINSDTNTVESKDGKRRVTFRNNKMSVGFGRYVGVRTAQLKVKVNGKWTMVASGRSEEAGKLFLRTGRY